MPNGFFGERQMRPMPVTPTPTQTRTEELNTTTQLGRGGTITTDEFASLETMVNKYGPEVVIQKVAKICKKKADTFAHEYLASAIGAAYKSISDKINSVFPAR